MKYRINVNEIHNPNCIKGCNKVARKEITENDICKDVNSIVDGLPIRCVGEWAMDKNFHLIQYFSIFASGMSKKWSEINYIEICSGPGRCVSRESGREFDGTAMNIINNQAFGKINKALFFDFSIDIVNTLNIRIKNLGIDESKAKAIVGDYFKPEELCDFICGEIRQSSLNLVFIDPTDCSIPFNLIRKLTSRIPNIDFIINLASGTDYNRNIVSALTKPESNNYLRMKYSRFLGNTEFLRDPENIDLALKKDNFRLRDKFRENYKESMKAMGYKYFEFERVRHYYDILFTSKHPRGLDYWKKVHVADLHGQRKLF